MGEGFGGAKLAPSAGNIQPWHFIVVTNAEKGEKLVKAPFAGFLREAPVVIVGCGNQRASPRWFMVDVAIAMQNMVLAATAEGDLRHAGSAASMRRAQKLS
ncbi:MAG: nitroreductase family protein [Candidatus Bathyarchaeia archaeon]